MEGITILFMVLHSIYEEFSERQCVSGKVALVTDTFYFSSIFEFDGDSQISNLKW